MGRVREALEQNLPLGRRLKNEGQDQTLENEGRAWTAEVVECIRRIAFLQSAFTMAEVRIRARAEGIAEPHHHNCWGGTLKAAVARGYIEPTNEYRQSTLPAAHARMLRVWNSRLIGAR